MKNKLRGFALLELLGALAVGTLLLIGLTSMVDASVDDMKGQQASLYQSQVYNAAVQYIQTNYGTLAGSANSTPPVPPPTTATVIQLSTLTNPTGGVAPYLPPNFATTNSYGQSTCVIVLPPINNQLQALVVTYGGQQINDVELSTIATNSGQGGGYISKTNSSVAQGGSWSLNASQLTPFDITPCLTGTTADGGHLASAIFFNGPGQLSTDYLYRSLVPNRPELNTMQTPLDLGGNAVVTVGSDCGTTAGLATDAANNILSCDNTGKWNPISTWKAPVVAYTDLPTTDQNGDVRMVTSLNRAFTLSNGTWVALAVDQNGDFTVPHNLTVTAGQLAVQAGGITASANIAAGQDLSATRDLTVGHDANITNTMTADGISAKTWAAAPGWTTETVQNPGAKCNYWNGSYNEDGSETIVWPTGSIAKDAQGIAVSCAIDSTFRYENGTYNPTPPATPAT